MRIKNVAEWLDRAAMKYPNKVAVSDGVCSFTYSELKELLTDAGFTNIRFEKQEDLITGWIIKDGSVESVTINGESDFTDNTSYRIDAEVVIIYHTFSE